MIQLTVESLSFAYNNSKTVLENVSFSVNKGEFVSLIGPNGVGKSTLFKCILGIIPNYSGNIFIKQKNARNMSIKERAKNIAYISQSHNSSFGYSVLDTVLMGSVRQLSVFSQPSKSQVNQALYFLEFLDILSLAYNNFSELSGGEQQLVLIARALAQQSDILLMDEPTSNLDFGNQTFILKQIKKLSKEGYTIIFSTHNPQHALNFSDKTLAIYDAKVVSFGKSLDIINSQLVETLYGVKSNFLDTKYGKIIIPDMEV